MVATRRSIRDWSYREAQVRLRRAGRTSLRSHSADVRLDRVANRIVECRCGWKGNVLGWITHLDGVVNGALRD